MTKKEHDHERYLRNREERLKKQREYYKAHRDEILSTRHMMGFMKYGTIRQNYERNTRNTTAR